jgi:hypothetical protein
VLANAHAVAEQAEVDASDIKLHLQQNREKMEGIDKKVKEMGGHLTVSSRILFAIKKSG